MGQFLQIVSALRTVWEESATNNDNHAGVSKGSSVSGVQLGVWQYYYPAERHHLFMKRSFFSQMVPPRGCAYCVLVNRLDASKVLVTLKNERILGNSLKVGTWHHLPKLQELCLVINFLNTSKASRVNCSIIQMLIFHSDIGNYYPTALRGVQITPKTSTNITRYLYSRGPVRQVFSQRLSDELD